MWWSMRPGPERAAAKLAHEKRFPQCEVSGRRHPARKVFPDGRTAWAASGRFYFFTSRIEERIQYRLAEAGQLPCPRNIILTEDGATGRYTGRRYFISDITTRLLANCLQEAGKMEFETTTARGQHV